MSLPSIRRMLTCCFQISTGSPSKCQILFKIKSSFIHVLQFLISHYIVSFLLTMIGVFCPWLVSSFGFSWVWLLVILGTRGSLISRGTSCCAFTDSFALGA